MKREGPYFPLHGLIHIKRLPIRTYFDAVSGPHVGSDPRELPVTTNAPDLPCAFLPVWITGEKQALGRNGHIVWLAHLVAVRQHGHRPRLRVDAQNVVLRIIRHEHDSGFVKANSARQAAVGEFDEYLTQAFRRNLPDGRCPQETDGVDVPRRVASRTFDPWGETVLDRQRFRHEEFLPGKQRRNGSKRHIHPD